MRVIDELFPFRIPIAPSSARNLLFPFIFVVSMSDYRRIIRSKNPVMIFGIEEEVALVTNVLPHWSFIIAEFGDL